MSEDYLLYRGKKVEDLSKEELIKALKFAHNRIMDLMEEKERERDFFLKGNMSDPRRRFDNNELIAAAILAVVAAIVIGSLLAYFTSRWFG